MRNINEKFFIEIAFTHSKNEPNNCPSGHSVEGHDFLFSPERLSPAKHPEYE
jgi:hypothetical protein